VAGALTENIGIVKMILGTFKLLKDVKLLV